MQMSIFDCLDPVGQVEGMGTTPAEPASVDQQADIFVLPATEFPGEAVLGPEPESVATAVTSQAAAPSTPADTMPAPAWCAQVLTAGLRSNKSALKAIEADIDASHIVLGAIGRLALSKRKSYDHAMAGGVASVFGWLADPTKAVMAADVAVLNSIFFSISEIPPAP